MARRRDFLLLSGETPAFLPCIPLNEDTELAKESVSDASLSNIPSDLLTAAAMAFSKLLFLGFLGREIRKSNQELNATVISQNLNIYVCPRIFT